MNRREYLLGGAGALAALAGGYAFTRGPLGTTRVEAHSIPVLGDSGWTSQSIPTADGLTLVDFFSTYCSGCTRQIDALEPVVADAPSAASFVSVTTQPIGEEFTRADLREWWASHGGPWPVGIDDGALANALGVERLPTLVLLDGVGRVEWSHAGVAETDAIREGLAEATR
ncbi:Thiol-disulfide isomerase or thioredoxin [Halanaeroarchaeum sp. HSR-CO]|uniref:TlpA family protein disulfide reductase n=1 Tax=Halanaeroarchaeum sp. HSR-CO TaxID=2866382 RepID=UPI00217EBEB7|nr:TlpA disulfide reductase family protein [Halanaeroarchaeum sp. HSR-CO]UWG49097.1 Thiol-disulfide isomerase or thioredoxin [Halanaeroarchaeum sp. HSR-CO]